MKKITYVLLAGVALISIFAIYSAVSQKDEPTLLEPSLKVLAAQQGKRIGNFAIRNRIQEPQYSNILSSQFDTALADNTPNWYFTDGGLRPARNEYYFDHMDEVMAYAESHSMSVQAHHYLWGEEKWLPAWLKEGNYSKDELYQIIDEHIQTMGSRYSGRIAEWTVVNESFTRGKNMYGLRDWWADATGGQEYIDRAFYAARRADPNSVLILNDFGNESINDVSNSMYDYIKGARTRGVPIDAIGMQMHIDGTHPPLKEEVISNMKRFGELGVDVYVTEFDVNMNDVKSDSKAKDEIEGDIYYDMARACIESDACKSFSILGITDKETWYSYMGLEDPRPLPFDENYQPKPAYYRLHQAFSEPKK